MLPIDSPKSIVAEEVLPSVRVKSSLTSFVGVAGGVSPGLGAVPSIMMFAFTPSFEGAASKFTVVVLSGTISNLLRLKAAGTPDNIPLQSFIYSIPSTLMSSVTSRIKGAGLNSRLFCVPSSASTSRSLMAIPYKGICPDTTLPDAFVSGMYASAVSNDSMLRNWILSASQLKISKRYLSGGSVNFKPSASPSICVIAPFSMG